MKKLLLKKADSDGENLFMIIDPSDSMAVYTLMKSKDSLLKECFTVRSESGDTVADIKREHILFTPAKLPKVTVSTKDGKRLIVKKEIEQLCDTISIEGGDLAITGDPFSDHFELLCADQCAATLSRMSDSEASYCVYADENDELLIILFAFAIELVK